MTLRVRRARKPSDLAASPYAIGVSPAEVDQSYELPPDRASHIANPERLRLLKAKHNNEIDIFNSHDPMDYEGCCDRR